MSSLHRSLIAQELRPLSVFIPLLGSFVLGEGCAYTHMPRELAGENEGLSQCISGAFAATLTFGPSTQCGIQLSCPLK